MSDNSNSMTPKN